MPSPLPDQRRPESAFFRAWARFVLRFRWPLLIATLCATGYFAYAAATRLVVDTTTEAFLSSRSQALAVLEELRQDFGDDVYFQVLVEGDVFTLPYLRRLRALHEQLEELDVELPDDAAAPEDEPPQAEPPLDDEFAGFGDDQWGDEAGGTVIEEIISLVNVRQTRWKHGGLAVEGLLEQWPTEKQLPALAERVLADRTLVGQVVGEAGRHSVITLRTQELPERDRARIYRALREVVAGHQADGFRIKVAGLPALNAELNSVMLDDMARMFTVAVIAILVILTVIFRHPLGILGPAAVVVQSAVWAAGAMALSDVPMTMVTNVLPAFLVCVGMADCVHIQSVYRDARRRGVGNDEAIVRAVAGTGMPILFTTLTTAVGLLSFRMASLGAIQDMGTFGALGVAVALLQSIVLLPIVLSWNKRSLLGVRDADTPDRVDRLLSFCNHLSRPHPGRERPSFRRRNLTLLAAGGLSTIAIAGALTLTVYHNPLTWMPDGHPTKNAIMTLNDHVGGTSNVALLIDTGQRGGLKDRELLLGLEKLEQHVRSYEQPGTGEHVIGNTTSILDVVRETWRAVNQGDESYYRIPDTQQGVVDMFTLFENAGPDQLRRLATVDLQKSVMTIRVSWLDALSYGPLTEHIRAGIERYIPETATVKTTGAVFNLFTVVQALLLDLLRSFGTAFIVITFLMVLVLRDLRLGLVAMVPNLLPIVYIMGFMGYIRMPIDANNLLIASIAIGIAVDDTIHMLHQFKVHYRLHGDVEAAIDHAFDHTGRALVTTSTILVSGFCVFMVAEMINIQRFGMLTGMSVVLALFIDLIFTPALLRWVYRPRAKITLTQGGSTHDTAAAAE